ncbi:MAG: DUF3560 domain-containing protein [Cyclobacteriaceae bacterium]
MKNDFHERKQNKIARYHEQAEKNQEKSEQDFSRAHQMASAIPFGQPILVGHHSEKRDRNFRAKINSIQDKAMQSNAKAQYYAEKASIAESNKAISSDDPEAIQKLTEKLDAMVQFQELMKAANKIIKNAKLNDQQKIEKLGEHNIKEKHAFQLLQPDYCNRIGFASYRLTNNNANINRIRKRILELEKINGMQSSEIEINGVKIYNNVEGNRVQIFFPDKPDDTTRATLKSHGFKWSPTEMAWQRQISNSAIYWAKQIVTRPDNPTTSESTSGYENNGPTGHGEQHHSDVDPGL